MVYDFLGTTFVNVHVSVRAGVDSREGVKLQRCKLSGR